MGAREQTLVKLTLSAYRDRDGRHPLGTFEAMYNPESIEVSYSADYTPEQYVNDQRQMSRYVRSNPGEVSLELMLDAIGTRSGGSIEAQLAHLRALCFDLDSGTGEPHFLKVQWGNVRWLSDNDAPREFWARMTQLEIDYSIFNRQAAPQRAVARITLAAIQRQQRIPAPGRLGGATPLRGLANRYKPRVQAGEVTPHAPALDIAVEFGQGGTLEQFRLTEVDVQTLINRLPSATLRWTSALNEHDDYDALQADLAQCAPDQPVTIKAAGNVLFEGLIVAREVTVRQGSKRLTLRVAHRVQRLSATHRSRVFAEQSDRQIIQAILKEHGVSVKWVGAHLEMIPASVELKHEQMVQYDCSDWAFVRARLAANGLWLLPQAQVSIGVPKLAIGAQHRLEANKPTSPIEEAMWLSNNRDMPHGVNVSAWNIGEQAMLPPKRGKAAKLGSHALDPASLKTPVDQAATWSLQYGVPLSATECGALANGRLLGQQAMGVQARFTLRGQADYQLGETLEVKGFGKQLDGLGVVTGVVHRFRAEENVWRTTVMLGLEAVREVDAPLVPKAQGLTVGVVDTFKTDPKTDWDRIRVKVPAIDESKPLWARITHLYASQDNGVFFYPEPGDEIVLGFFENDPRFPVMLGAMHNPKNKAPHKLDAKNDVKGMILQDNKNGNQYERRYEWLFDRDKQEVKVNYFNTKTVDGEPKNQFKLSDQDGIMLASQDGDIQLSATFGQGKKNGNVRVTADKDMTIQVHDTITQAVGDPKQADKQIQLAIDAKSTRQVTLRNPQGDIEMQADKQLKVHAKDKVGIQSGEESVTIEADKQIKVSSTKKIELDVSGGDEVVVKAPKVEVEGKDSVTINGSKSTVSLASGKAQIESNKVDINGTTAVDITGKTIDLKN
ncbi:phage baseplate assembly protein V [Mycetohabitans rhizoxinica]|uniref:CIS tube protein n=1 Tax=Mycetohabitans rhizoxinica TaxID=412963 RepID=UPI0030D595DA